MNKIGSIFFLGIQISNIALGQNEQKEGNLVINRAEYKDKLKGFWLGSCIANWTGLPTETNALIFPFLPMMI